MTVSQGYFKGLDSYITYGEDTAWGTAATPSGTSYVDRLKNFSHQITNNQIRSQGLGDGRNAQSAVLGNLDVNGNFDWELTNPAFIQYCIIGSLVGSGTSGTPYKIQEEGNLGYETGQVNTLTLERGSEGGNTDDVLRLDGVAINNFTMNMNIGEIITCTADYIARTVNSSSTVLTYTGSALRPMTFVEGSVAISGDTIGLLQSFSWTCANNLQTFRSMGSRLINKPEAGVRRYDFTMTMKLHADTTASVLSGLEARGYAYAGVTTASTPLNSGFATAKALTITVNEGATTGCRILTVQFENVYFESYSEPIALDDGLIEITIGGFALAGLTDSSEKTVMSWYSL